MSSCKMYCHYCHQETREVSKMCIHPDQIILWFMCEICHVTYEFNNDKLVNKCIYAITIRNKGYSIQFHFPENSTSINFWDAKQDHPPSQVLHHFNFILDWTPFNAKEKLERLLVFM